MARPGTYDYWVERRRAQRLAADIVRDAAQLAAQMRRLADPDAGSELGEWHELARTAVRLAGEAMTLRDHASCAAEALRTWDGAHDLDVDAA